jgi:asparagine synthase (glutamine-hydrolysing)
MCGISGIVSFNQANENLLPWTIAMNQTISHRGPDDEGFVGFHDKAISVFGSDDTPTDAWNNQYPYLPNRHINQYSSRFSVVLGHRRLSIINLSPAGHQPMCDKEQRYWIVFNGEIYNYKELRSELHSLGYSFASSSDTEVLLNSYLAWGTSCVNKFIGMWAFVIYDTKEMKLFASRDRIGVKPFYYINNQNYFAFASELKALKTLPFASKEINNKAVFDYLVLGKSELEEESIFKNIYELSPGNNLEIDIQSKSFKKTSYLNSSYNAKWESFNELKNQNFKKELKELLYNTIDLHLRADVTIGACLSGGLDSSIITGIISEKIKKFPVFTVTSLGDKEDESVWAKKMVDKYDLEWHTTNPTSSNLLSNFDQLMYLQDLPCLSANSYTHYELMRLVNQSGVKVTIDGQGADELFAGYSQYYAAYMLEALSHGSIGSVVTSFLKEGNDFAQKKLAFSIPMNIAAAHLFGNKITSRTFRSKYPEFNFINNDFWNSYSDRIEVLNTKIHLGLNKTLFNEFHGSGLKTMLRVTDRNSMNFGIETRVPFSDDYRLEELAFQIPSTYKVRNNNGKAILRATAEEWLPNEICYRKDKKGFSTPEKRWMIDMANESLEYFDQGLEQYFDLKSLKKDWRIILDNSTSTVRIWRILCFAAWMKVWANK